ncbi:hypothetical protein BGZ60DRAFT_88125 [Tricladium varicosporioides]|nr:hypothetical protein BGZ60DRAFT_88125 [Hymenoscyphus varicosporioides]
MIRGDQYSRMANTSFTPLHTDPAIALQQMYELDAIQWQGGENYFDGPHDTFCFLCASPNTTSSLFSCSTCENCYHAECMTPSLSPDDVPRFWFCPHCVERGNHVPDLNSGEVEVGSEMVETNYVSSVQDVIAEMEDPSGKEGGANEVLSGGRQTMVITPPQKHPPSETRSSGGNYQDQMNVPTEQNRRKEFQPSMVDLPASENTVPKPTPLLDPKSVTQMQPSTSRKRFPPPPPSSTISKQPPKKKSKYSTLPSALEKALLLITTELEKSSSITSSTSSLQSQINILEQKIRMMEGQAALKDKEMEKQMKGMREENEKLRGEVEKKERELRELKGNLRGLVGD